MNKLMIVDDHAGVRTLIRELVASRSDLVKECASGEEAIRLALQFQPTCVTMDLRMEGMGGIQATKALRVLCPAAQILVVSAFDQPDLRRAADEAGAHRYLLKENLVELRAAVRAALEPRPAGAAAVEERPARRSADA
jgi:NarL family two-component system response regulator LiaR